MGKEQTPRQCAFCGTPLPPLAHARRKYCSERCQRRATRAGLTVVSDDWCASPEDWDGLTFVSEQPALCLSYRVYCVNCGADEWLDATYTEVCATRRLDPCERCGGTRWIEPDLGSRSPATMIGEAA